MSHEQSETEQLPDGRWVNVYGRSTLDAGKRLPGSPTFDDLEAAIAAARKRSHDFDPEMERAVFGIMADQAAGRMRGAPPPVRYENQIGRYLDTPLPQANFDGQLGYDTTLPQAPKEFPSYRDEVEDPFMDRVIKVMRRMGLTGPANFIGKTLAAQPGPRFSNREVIQTETGPLGDANTIERGVGFSNLSAEDRRPPSPREVGEGFFNPVSGLAGILAGPKALTAPNRLREIADLIPGGKPQQIWREHGVAQGAEGLPRFEIPDDSAYINPEVWRILEKGPNVQVLRKGSEILNHPRLFEAYPHLEGQDISLHRRPGQASGRYNPKTGSVGVGADDPEEMLSVLLHELQHGVQRYEGFAPGGSSKMRLPYEGLDRLSDQELKDFLKDMAMVGVRSPNMRAYARMGGEVEARNVQARHMDPNLRSFTPEFTEDIPRKWQLLDVPHNAMFDEASPLQDDFMKKYTDLMLQLGRAKSMGADQKTLADLQIELGRLERRMTQAGRGRPPEEWDSVKEPGGMWSPLAPMRMTAYLMGELEGTPQAATRLLNNPHFRDPSDPQLFTTWAERVSRNYLNKYAGTERDPIKDLPVTAHTRAFEREPLTQGDRNRLQAELDAINENIRIGEGISPWGRRRRSQVSRILREGAYTGIAPTREDRPWGKIMDSVIREMPFEQFLSIIGKNRVSMGRQPRHIQEELAHLENAYRMGRIKGTDPIYTLRKTTALRDFPTTFKETLGHVGADTRAHVQPDDFRNYDFPRAMRETRERDTRQLKEASAKALEDVFKGTKTIKEYPEEGFRWVEVGKSSLKELPDGEKLTSPELAAKKLKEMQHYEARRALQKEGDLMGHCVGGYCDAVESGRSKIFSLRDKKGEPHVTVEVRPGGLKHITLSLMEDIFGSRVAGDLWAEWRDKSTEYLSQAVKDGDPVTSRGGERGFNLFMANEHPELLDQYLKGRRAGDSVIQVKGKQNRAPVKEYQKYVQDFIRQGKWEEVHDLSNTGLIAKKSISEDDLRFWNRETGASRRLNEQERAAAMEDLKNMPNYLTREEFDAFLQKHGGATMKKPGDDERFALDA